MGEKKDSIFYSENIIESQTSSVIKRSWNIENITSNLHRF